MMTAPLQYTKEIAAIRLLHHPILLSLLIFAAIAIYIFLDSFPMPRQAVVQPPMDERQSAENTRKQSAVAGQDIDSPKRVLTAEEIESGKW